MQDLLSLCTFPVQVVQYFYHGQKMTYLFLRECQTKSAIYLPKSFSMLSRANSLFYY